MIALGLAEVVMRGYQRLVPGSSVGRISINDQGFRGPSVNRAKPEGTVRIVCLGGSSVFGTGNTDDGTTWHPEKTTRSFASPHSTR